MYPFYSSIFYEYWHTLPAVKRHENRNINKYVQTDIRRLDARLFRVTFTWKEARLLHFIPAMQSHLLIAIFRCPFVSFAGCLPCNRITVFRSGTTATFQLHSAGCRLKFLRQRNYQATCTFAMKFRALPALLASVQAFELQKKLSGEFREKKRKQGKKYSCDDLRSGTL